MRAPGTRESREEAAHGGTEARAGDIDFHGLDIELRFRRSGFDFFGLKRETGAIRSGFGFHAHAGSSRASGIITLPTVSAARSLARWHPLRQVASLFCRRRNSLEPTQVAHGPAFCGWLPSDWSTSTAKAVMPGIVSS